MITHMKHPFIDPKGGMEKALFENVNDRPRGSMRDVLWPWHFTFRYGQCGGYGNGCPGFLFPDKGQMFFYEPNQFIR